MDTQNGETTPPSVGEASPGFSVPETSDDSAKAYARALAERIRACRGSGNRAWFAQQLGVHVNTVGKLERGETLPDALTLLKIADIGKRSVQWLVTGIEPGGEAAEGVPLSLRAVDSGSYVHVPHFDINASAGHGNLFNSIESVIAMRPFDQSFIRGELGIAHDELALIFVVGPSMEPLLHSHDTVLVDLKAGYEAFNDGIHVIRLDQALLIKQVQKIPGKAFRIRSLNEDYASFDIKGTEEAERDFAIIGRVRWAGVTIK
jgi:phage repressor protein C with HTH and peptisase S24 domain